MPHRRISSGEIKRKEESEAAANQVQVRLLQLRQAHRLLSIRFHGSTSILGRWATSRFQSMKMAWNSNLGLFRRIRAPGPSSLGQLEHTVTGLGSKGSTTQRQR